MSAMLVFFRSSRRRMIDEMTEHPGGLRASFARAIRVSAADWRLLAGASLMHVLAWFALRTAPVPRARAMCAHLRPVTNLILRGSDARVIWAIEASGRRLAGLSTCLVRAIIVDVCLSTRERPLRVVIGVRRTIAGEFQSHAWVDDRDRILIGGSKASTAEFVPVVAWPSITA